MTTGIIVPAHMGSTRFPGKPLAMVGGKPLLSYAVEAARESGMPFCVATPDDDIEEWCYDLYSDTDLHNRTTLCFKTDACRNGTERAAIVNRHVRWDRVIVLQCDEPDVTGEDLKIMASYEYIPQTFVSSMQEADWNNKNSVAAYVLKCNDSGGVVRCFTRLAEKDCMYRRHVGVYFYDSKTLEMYMGLEPVESEVSMSLEQLRIMQIFAWYAIFLNRPLRSVNVPEDVEQFK